MKTATIRARTEPSLKADAERVFRKLGISSSEAINLFYSQVRLRKGLPFPVEIPNAVTRQTFEKVERVPLVGPPGALTVTPSPVSWPGNHWVTTADIGFRLFSLSG